MPDSSRPKRPRKTKTAPTADRAIAEALAIVREARDVDADHDWTHNPLNERAAKWRAAIIHRIVANERADRASFDDLLGRTGCTEEQRALSESSMACSILSALELLLPDGDRYSDEIGDDLREAIDYWDQVFDQQYKLQKQLRRRRLAQEARLDIEPASGLS